MLTLETPISQLTPVGKTVARRLKKLGLETVQDLLFYYPFRYDDFSRITTIDKLQPDTIATIKGKIEIIQNKRSLKKRKIITEALVADKTGSIKAVWFGQPFLIKAMKPGDEVYLSGKIEYDYYTIQMTSPSYEKISSWKKDTTHTARLVPIYSVTENLTQKQIRFLTKLVLPLAKKIKDWLPGEIKKEFDFNDLASTLSQIHFPADKVSLEKARHRLKFEELFLIQLQAQSIKQKLQKSKAYSIKFKEKETKKFVESLPFKLTDSQRKTAWKILQDLEHERPMNRLLEGEVGSGKTIVATIAMLNTVLNGCQVAYLAPTEILAKQHFETISELLRSFKVNIGLLTRTDKRITKYEIRKDTKVRNTKKQMEVTRQMGVTKQIGVVKRSASQRRASRPGAKLGQESSLCYSAQLDCSSTQEIRKSDLIKKIKNNQINILIGTHALLEENIQFENLALAIIDEQHRFGVEQRARLRCQMSDVKYQISDIRCQMPIKDELRGRVEWSPHFLSMTATPIPRSLALALYGDLDLSIINELPAERKKIITKIIEPQDRQRAYQFIREEIKRGHQVFVICPLIDPSDKLGVHPVRNFSKNKSLFLNNSSNDFQNYSFATNISNGVKSAKDEYEKLKKQVFPDLKIGLLHGRLKPKEKEKVRQEFLNNKINILVATSVIEVGVDIPNATVMMIEGAERFGLAQLYQFRGRVGRAEHQSYCFLFTETSGQKTQERLKAILTAKNCFELAEKDLEIRGPGEIYGVQQSGYLANLKIAYLTDYPIIQQAKVWAERILENDPDLKNYPALKEKIVELEKPIHLE